MGGEYRRGLPSSKRGSPDVVVSLMNDSALVLTTDMVSKFIALEDMGCEMAENPEMDGAPDRKLPERADCGLRSGNRALTSVAISAGLITR